MKVKQFKPITIRPAANGVIVETDGRPGEIVSAYSLHVFTSWEEFEAHLSGVIIELNAVPGKCVNI